MSFSKGKRRFSKHQQQVEDLADVASVPILPHVYDMTQWSLQDVVGRPTDPRESLHVFARVQR